MAAALSRLRTVTCTAEEETNRQRAHASKSVLSGEMETEIAGNTGRREGGDGGIQKE